MIQEDIMMAVFVADKMLRFEFRQEGRGCRQEEVEDEKQSTNTRNGPPFIPQPNLHYCPLGLSENMAV